jgi:hypothetical protein
VASKVILREIVLIARTDNSSSHVPVSPRRRRIKRATSLSLMTMTARPLIPQKPYLLLRGSSDSPKRNAMNLWTICERTERIWIFRMPERNGSRPGDRHRIDVHS